MMLLSAQYAYQVLRFVLRTCAHGKGTYLVRFFAWHDDDSKWNLPQRS